MTHDGNGALTRVGPGTLMADLPREYWIPALPSADLGPRTDPPPLPDLEWNLGGAVGDGPSSVNGKARVPIDDEGTLVFEWQLRPGRAWSDDERAAPARVRHSRGFVPATGAAASAFQPRANFGNDHLRDRSLEASRQLCGIASHPMQDAAAQESMGPIVDRTKEHLGPADAMIVRVRGEIPSGVDEPGLYRARREAFAACEASPCGLEPGAA